MLMFCVNNLMHRQNNKNRAHTRTCKQMMSAYKAVAAAYLSLLWFALCTAVSSQRFPLREDTAATV